MTTAIYTRVSSNQQDTRSQEQDLRTWAGNQPEPVTWYTDRATGKTFDRHGWRRLEQAIVLGKVKRLVVWRLDRLGRTAGETITLLDRLDQQGVGFLSLRDGFDPSTPAGRLMRNMLASVAQFETEVRSERQRAGIRAAKASGKTWGGRKAGTRITLTVEKERAARTMKDNKVPVAVIARTLGLSRKTVYSALARA
jgi:DNA invertase Pin-like site-specific DNA recombinase